PAAAAAPPPPPSGDLLAVLPLPIEGRSVPYWDARDQENQLELLLGGRPNVLFLGDSITDGLASGAGQPVWDSSFAPLGSADFAIAGLTTSEVLWQVETGQVAVASPDVVVLMIGTNNLGLGQSPAATADGVTEILSGIQAQLPDVRVLVLGLLPRGQSPADPFRAQVAEVNRRLTILDDGNRVRFLDVGGAFLQPDGWISPDVMPDFLHPSEWGYRIYTAGVRDTLTGMLAER